MTRPPATMLDAWMTELLVCPYDGCQLSESDAHLVCSDGHRFAVIDGIPIMLRNNVEQTHWVADLALSAAETPTKPEEEASAPHDRVDPFVQAAIGATNGRMYRSLIGRLQVYPIPQLLLPPGEGKTFIELGCNWGRWCFAAKRLGYTPIGIDPSLEALRAAKRVGRQLGLECRFVVADARYLPFKDGAFDTVFSYSVIQHFSKADAKAAVAEAGRVLTRSGNCLIQMPNRFGLLSTYHLARRRFHEGILFQVRYWTPGELKRTFEALIGPSNVFVDGVFTLNPQACDARMLPLHCRVAVYLSLMARKLSHRMGWIRYLADSLYVSSTKAAQGIGGLH